MLIEKQMRNAECGIRNLAQSADRIVRRFRNPQSAICTYIRILLILCMMSLAGCGYQMVGKETHVPPGMTSIAIPTFKNQTFEPGIEIQFTQAFLNEFIQDRRVKVVTQAEADTILTGVMKSFTAYGVAYDKSGFVLQYQISVIADLTVTDRTGKVLWQEKNSSENQWFRASSVGVTNEAAKQVAIQRTAASMAERIRNRFFYNF
jgi:outer membrane lipopolysaccharide assembly protein LptE/RlpB